jgi:hypothetical protein
MIAQNQTETQEVIEEIFHKIPIVLIGRDSCAYVLVHDLREEIENFILTGKIDKNEIHIFSNEKEQELEKEWREQGLEFSYHKQPMEYMRKTVTFIYPQVKNPETEVNIALIPWFMLPDRPYSAITYLFGIRHYINTGQKSMQESAEVTKEMFRLESFDKSTLSRSIKAMGGVFDISINDEAPPTDMPKALPTTDVISRIPEWLKSYPTIESLAEGCGVKAAPLPPPVNQNLAAARALIAIPGNLTEVVRDKTLNRNERRDTRKRTTRSQEKKKTAAKRRLNLIESWKIDLKRIDFIKHCKAAVLDMAITHHRFLI